MFDDRSSSSAREETASWPTAGHDVRQEEQDLLAGAGFWLLGGASLLGWTALSLLLTSA